MTVRYLVMPRGINVGTRNRVPMADLRSSLADAGYGDVATVLQSGNIIVSSETDDPAGVGDDVRRLLRDDFEVNVACVARSADEVRAVFDRNPLADVADDGSRYLVNFLSEVPNAAAIDAVMAEDHAPEVIACDGAEVYVWTPGGVKAMTVSYSYLEKRLGVTVTARNWNTLQKVIAKF